MSTPTEGPSTEADAIPWHQRTTPAGTPRPRARDFQDRDQARRPPPPTSDSDGSTGRDRVSGGPGIPRREEPPIDQHEEDDGS